MDTCYDCEEKKDISMCTKCEENVCIVCEKFHICDQVHDCRSCKRRDNWGEVCPACGEYTCYGCINSFDDTLDDNTTTKCCVEAIVLTIFSKEDKEGNNPTHIIVGKNSTILVKLLAIYLSGNEEGEEWKNFREYATDVARDIVREKITKPRLKSIYIAHFKTVLVSL